MMVIRAFGNQEKFGAFERRSGELLGTVSFSRQDNSIRELWLGKRHGEVGAKLLKCALNQLDWEKEIVFVNVKEEDHSLLTDFGFEANAEGMVLPPRCGAIKGKSFHFNYERYTDWAEPMHCPVCQSLSGPPDMVLIKEFEHSWLEATREAQGGLWGKCHLLAKKHYLELYEMSSEDLLGFMEDVQKASKALKAVTGAVKINYEIHGNSMPHLHVHFFPRYLDDPFPSGPIDYRITEPNPYGDDAGFSWFIEEMQKAIEAI